MILYPCQHFRLKSKVCTHTCSLFLRRGFKVIMKAIPCPISRHDLAQLYHKEKLTDDKIADRLGADVTPKRVRVWRSRLGIRTLKRWERHNVPPIKGKLRSLLVGSMLGDGRIDRRGDTSIYQENHTQSQRSYLEWKIALWGDWVRTKMKPVRWESSGKTFVGVRVHTVSHPLLNEWHSLFYPTTGPKQIHDERVVNMVDAFALCVWFLDDGFAGWWPEISFGMDIKSRAMAQRIFTRLGLNPCWKPQHKTTGVFRFRDADAEKFVSLITPHVPSHMAYKLCFGYNTGRNNIRKKDLLGNKRIIQEMASQEVPIRKMARILNVPPTTLSRFLSAQQISHPRRVGQPKRVSTPIDLSVYDPTKWPTLGSEDQDRWVDDIYRVLRFVPLPVSTPLETNAANEDFLKVQSAEMTLQDGLIHPYRRVGINLCTSHFPNRYTARSGNRASALEAWHDEKLLKRAIRFQLKVGDPVLPHRVLRAVTMNCRTPTIFRPTVARFIYDRYCPKGGSVWDPCAGYGGRLLGALTVGVHYTGTDVEDATIKGNQELAVVLGHSQHVSLYCCPAEEFEPPPVDLVFTSPPYFQQEQYAGGAQSWKRYGTIDSWVDGFLRPLLRKARVAPILVLNIADVRDDPLVAITEKVASTEGWALREKMWMPLAALNRSKPKEPVLMFDRV